MTPPRTELVVFDTHPIQYRSPVFRVLERELPNFKAIYFSSSFNANRWWFYEVNKIPKQTWGIPLQEGFSSECWNSPNLLQFILKSRSFLKKERPKAAIIYGYYLLEHWVLWLLCSVYRIPMIFIGETYEPANQTKNFRSSIRAALRKLFISKFSAFVSIGAKNSSFYKSLGIANHQIFQAKYGIDNHFFERENGQREATRKAIRNEHGISDDALVLLFVGRLFERKRPLDLVKLHELLPSQKIVTLVIGNGELEEDLRQQSRHLTNFKMLGFKNQQEIRDYYAASDILIVPSEFETWGLVANEAFASGMTAAVTNNCGSANDLVITNQTGFVFEVGNVSQLSSWISRILTEPFLLAKLKSNALLKVREYNPEQFSEKIISAYQSVILHSTDRKIETHRRTGTSI